MRRIKKFLTARTLIVVAIIVVALLNLLNTFSRGLPNETNNTVAINRQQLSLNIRQLYLTTREIMKGNITHYPVSKDKPHLTTQETMKRDVVNYRLAPDKPHLTTQEPMNINVVKYRLAPDKVNHYEFRSEFNTRSTNDEHRLLILINGAGRTCIDYWEFPVGRRLLSAFRTYGFSMLAICSTRRKFDVSATLQTNLDVKWVYLSLQKWMNEVYYKQFQRYPHLYTHGISRGSRFAPMLSRILPIQGQILTIYPAHNEAMLTRSDHHVDMQTRLALDPVFANWFYFDFCYNIKMENMSDRDICPFQSNRRYYQPVPPTYFVHLRNDPWLKEPLYRSIIAKTREDAFHLGGRLLNQTEAIELYILQPSKATSTYMQETFDLWRFKPHASRLFFEHFKAPKLYRTKDRKRRTCVCSPIDFTHYEQFPNITQTWPKQKQEEYNDYVSDVKKFRKFFCEEVCGDLLARHAIAARDIDKALKWAIRMDHLRHSFLINDYLTRPLRIWMYEKNSLTTDAKYFTSQEANWVNMSKSYQMYSPEYHLQDYFQRLNASRTFSHHHLKWADNPLLADYFIIPSDLMFYYFYHEPANMTDLQFQNLRNILNNAYFRPLLRKIRTLFSYWTMAKHADEIGSNHIIAIPGDTNMGLLQENMQRVLKNVIQLTFTGVRQDLLPPELQSQYVYRTMTTVYRHNYDVVIPPFTRLRLNESIFPNLNLTLQKKKRLFFFAGALNHSNSSQSARMQLSDLSQDIRNGKRYNMMTKILEKQFDTITVIDGDLKTDEYVESVSSSVFSLCPEGLLPWSPRLYDSIQLAAIPLILADNIVLPFERFINWRSFSVKLNVSNIENMIDMVARINKFDMYVKEKLGNATPYLNAFQWPYSAVGENGQTKHAFLPLEDMNGDAKNVFHYISLELRCRRLEQLYGLTSESFSEKSIRAQRQACKEHGTICPCHNERLSLAFQEYI